MEKTTKKPLWTRNFICACFANFSLYSGFYLLLPVLPFYLTDTFKADISLVGIALSCYTLAALMIRPFSGFAVDFLPRKAMYIFMYLFFILTFPLYPLMGSIALFVLVRMFHGLTFGAVTTAGTTLVIDIMPSERRGEGLGYFGVMNNLAMALGPMVGLLVYEKFGYGVLFFIAFIMGFLGWLIALEIHPPQRARVLRPPLSLDRFFLVKGIIAGLVCFLVAIPFGMFSTYVAMLGATIGLKEGTGFFFVLLAAGLILSRVFSGPRVDRGKITQMISLGILVIIPAVFGLSVVEELIRWNDLAGEFLYFFTAFLLGTGYGTIFPAFNALFVNLAPASQRGTAVSTYLTSWDLGVGAGILAGGLLNQYLGISQSFFIGAMLTLLALFLFVKFAAGHYQRNKIAVIPSDEV